MLFIDDFAIIISHSLRRNTFFFVRKMQSRKDAAPRGNVSLEYIQITGGGVSSPIRRGGRNYFSGSIISDYEFHLPFRWIDLLAVDIPLHSYSFPFHFLRRHPFDLFLAFFDGIWPSLSFPSVLCQFSLSPLLSLLPSFLSSFPSRLPSLSPIWLFRHRDVIA